MVSSSGPRLGAGHRHPSILCPLVPILSTLLAAGCSQEYLDCVAEWQECSSQCPDDDAVQAALDAAEADYRACMQACPPLDPNAPEAQQLAAGRCILRCLEDRDAAIEAATACTESCDDRFAECTGAIRGCSDPTSTQYLTPVQVVDWTAHTSGDLDDPSHGFFVCEDHFPLYSPERSAVLAAVQQYIGIPGSTIGLFALSRPHQDKSQLFATPASSSGFDYVDNAADSFVHPCHTDNTTACGDSPDGTINGFTINTCSYASGTWGAGGDREFVNITANGACYAYFSDPTSDDYVGDTGALHELGHATGMKHTGGWPTADKGYISTMQGKLKYLSAYDVAFLRAQYATWSDPHRDFVASSKIRIDFGGANEVSGTFGEENPSRMYLVGDQVYDCDTQQPAVFRAAWFNTGNADQETDHCMINELRLEDPHSHHEAEIVRWHAAQMPAESQDHWVGGSDTEASDFAYISLGVDIDLVFEVNLFEPWREPTVNSVVRTPVQLFADASCTPPPASPLPPAPVRRIAPDAYDIAPAFLDQVVRDPLRIARETRVAPRPVAGGGIGLKILSLDEGSVLGLLGAKVGDVLWRVDGHPINGPATAWDALRRLRSGSPVVAAFVRDRTMRQVTYRSR